MNEGKIFETNFKVSCEKTGFFFMRLRDGAKWVQGQGASFTPSNPCDAILHSMPFMWLLELKSTKGASISFYPNTPWERPKDSSREVMIKPNQVRELGLFAKAQGVIPGFIMNFRPRELKSGTTQNKVYFVHIKDFIDFAVRTGKSSINENECAEMGVEINSTLKKTHYGYDITYFVNQAIPFYVGKGYINTEHLKAVLEWLKRIVEQ
jgi:hypothetical protein